MVTVTLGKTGITVNKNGFGALPIQRISDEAAVSLLRKAFQHGITFFDTARFYTDSEHKIGLAFAGMRQQVYIATKTGAVTAEGFWKDLETSLGELNTDYVDLYQFHNPSFCPVPGDGSGLYEAMLQAKAEGKEKPQVDNYIAECIIKIANHLSYLPNFSGYTYRQDFVEDAIENCIHYVDNFNPEISKNPFAYFTQICWYAFIRHIMKEKKQSIVKGKLIMGMTYDEALMIDEDTNKAVMEDTLRNTHTFVELAAEEEKKQKQKADERKAQREAKKSKAKTQTSLEELFE